MPFSTVDAAHVIALGILRRIQVLVPMGIAVVGCWLMVYLSPISSPFLLVGRALVSGRGLPSVWRVLQLYCFRGFLGSTSNRVKALVKFVSG